MKEGGFRNGTRKAERKKKKEGVSSKKGRKRTIKRRRKGKRLNPKTEGTEGMNELVA